MTEKIKNLLKSNHCIYLVYNIIFSSLLRILSFFIKIDDKMILFNSYGGKKFDDSPKAIYDYMVESGKYSDYKMIWAIDDCSIIDNINTLYVKNNTLNFFVTALKSKYWITNSSIERGLKFKPKETIYINTWHGSAFKLMGQDMKNKNTNYKVSMSNYFYAQSKYDVKVFSKAYGYDQNRILIVGLPRNDELCNVNDEDISLIRNKLKIPKNKKVILYAPTFREYDRDLNGCIIAPPIDIKYLEKELSDQYIVLFRAHYEVSKVMNISNNNFIFNVTNYPKLNDLLKISDILISDYSSIMIDYSILERPIYCYAYDYDKYREKRGLYVDLEKELPNGICVTEKQLIDSIKKCNFDTQQKKTKKFKEKYVEVCGDSRKFVDKIILKEM